jgi:hypothetical protein
VNTKKYYQGAVGVWVRVNTNVDLSGATLVKLLVRKPSAAVVTWTGTAVDETNEEMQRRQQGDPSAVPMRLKSIISYVTISGDFSEVGIHKVQSFLKSPAGEWPGGTTTFTVSPPWAM